MNDVFHLQLTANFLQTCWIENVSVNIKNWSVGCIYLCPKHLPCIIETDVWTKRGYNFAISIRKMPIVFVTSSKAYVGMVPPEDLCHARVFLKLKNCNTSEPVTLFHNNFSWCARKCVENVFNKIISTVVYDWTKKKKRRKHNTKQHNHIL